MLHFARSFVRTATLAATLAWSAVGTQAASLSTSGGSAFDLASAAGTFNPTWFGDLSGYAAEFDLATMLRGATLSVSGPTTVTYTLVGYEAAYNNAFVAGTGRLDNRSGTTPMLGTSFSFDLSAGGVLDFGFLSQGMGPLFGNGSTSTGLILSADRRGALLLFNDTFPGDSDFDDMVVRLTVTAVPEPAATAMLAAGLGLVSLVVRRSRQR